MKYFFYSILIIFLDQFTKKVIKDNIEIGREIEIIKDKFYITHTENKGAAYGIFSSNPKLLKGFTIISIFSLINYFKNNTSKNQIIISLITAGGIGNLIDRIKRKSVTDFLWIKGKNTPIFNIADLSLFIGGILFILKSFNDKD